MNAEEIENMNIRDENEIENISINEHDKIIENLKKEFENKLKETMHNISEKNKKIQEKHDADILNIKIKAIDQINTSKKTLESSFYNKEKKMITSMCKDLQFYIETFIQQVQLRFEKDEELPHMIDLFNENINTLFEDLHIQLLNTQIGDEYKADAHKLSSIINTNDNNLNDTIASVIKQGFKYNNQIITPSIVNIYKFQ